MLVIGLLLFCGRWVVRQLDRDARLLERQVRNHQRVAFYRQALMRHRERLGTYPLSLLDSLDPSEIPGGIARGVPLRDVWDHPMRYYSDGRIFLLVSVGRDGKPDGGEYHEFRRPGPTTDICGSPDADVVVSDLGWHATCEAIP